MVKISRSKSNMATKKMFGGDHPGLVDPSNLGLDLGITDGDMTTPEMTVGGTADVPIADAGIVISEPDLTAAELLGGAADKGAADKKRLYNVVHVVGSVMPSENARYKGPTPSMAITKAARRIHRKNPSKLEFSVVMRRVSQRHVERELYQYDVQMKKTPKPGGMLTVEVDAFEDTAKVFHKNAQKKVKIVQQSDHPVFGYINAAGKGIANAAAAATEPFKLVRSPGTNTLYLVSPDGLPDDVHGLPVQKLLWDVDSKKVTDISEAIREEFDTARKARERELAEKQRVKERDAKKKEAEREKARVQKEKEHKAKMKLNAAARSAAKKDRDAILKEDKKQKEKSRKEAASAKGKKASAKKNATSS
jgi:hypothetical protein